MTAETLVSKLWNYCNPAAAGRDDGLSYGDYVEQQKSSLTVISRRM